ncbi:mitochondrion protein [Moniliophthora roreri MCA 2997]|uniref:Mitochondrion protein n=1 Tax=Moniliophthora roreri (strain MCA 2997) TaxID=1381753 RepID=V2X5X7_MONRO|nr:mitochondrion protein [Moniliophthora roreri MCA 2997]
MVASSHIQKILVVGGNGFIGSAVCRAALARGMEVTSVSSSGLPYTTPKGHSPAWTSKVTWLKGSALDPTSFARVLPEMGGVVHTLGTLIEGGAYKAALKENDLPKMIGGFLGGIMESINGSNPLEQSRKQGSYETLNRDAALRICEAFVSSGEGKTYSVPRPFVYISAEDIFRPVIPARYIETKREAERGIETLVSDKPEQFRGVYMRPSLVYHAHYRPLTTPAAVLLDLSAALHAKVPPGIPKPSDVLRTFGSAFSPRTISSSSIANAMTIPPIHVDHVAEAICVALQSEDVRGAIGVNRMRELIGWHQLGSDHRVTGQSSFSR